MRNNRRNNRNIRSARNNKNNKKRKPEFNYEKNIKILGFSVFILFVFFIGMVIFYNLNNKLVEEKLAKETEQNSQNKSANETIETSAPVQPEEKAAKDITFTMSAIGDVMCHNTQYKDAYNKDTGEYDFSYVFNDVRSHLRNTDIAVGSLETTFAGEERGYSNYPTFNSPDALAYSLKDIGIDVLSTAGNHSLDTGFSGLSRTIDVLDKADISHVGTYKTQEEQDQVLFKFVKGAKVAFINYTYGTNSIPVPSDKKFSVNLIDKDLIKKHIETAKSQNADVIVACMHWGTEYRTTPTSEQKELSDFLFKNGVDIILGSHPHVLEPMEKRTVTLDDGSTKEGFVIYSLGNFICDQNAKNTRNSIILDLTITKHSDGKVTVNKANYTPIYMYKNTSLPIKKMKVLDIEKSISLYESGDDTSIGKNTYNDLKTQLKQIKSLVGNEIN